MTFGLYFWLLQRMAATRLALIAHITPVCAVALGILALGETATLRTAAGSAVVLLGVALASRKG